MASRLVVSGLVGGLVAVSSWSAMAQEAQPARSDCSGFLCSVFGSKIEDRRAPQAAPAPATAAATAAIADPADPADPAPAASSGRSTPRKAAKKPVPTVTIAAGEVEIARLKTLSAALPKTHVRIVGSNAGASADFSVVPAVDGAAPTEKARLFTEELHVVAGPGIRSLRDLEGKVVSFGPNKSSTQAAARRAFAALGIRVQETPLEIDNALDGMATGDVAAAVVLAPQPDVRLAKLKTTSGLHLVAWPESATVPDGASITTISGSAYPGLAKPGDSIRAIGIEAALDASAHGASSAGAKAFLVALSQRTDLLSKRGFDLLKADLESRSGRRVASAERR